MDVPIYASRIEILIRVFSSFPLRLVTLSHGITSIYPGTLPILLQEDLQLRALQWIH